MGNVISIISDSTASNVASNRLGPGSFTGDTNVEFTFVGSVNGSLNASTFPSPGHSASQDLVRGVEELVSATIGHEEAGRVSLAVGMRPRVDIITDIECPTTLTYEAGTTCLHFVIEVPLTIANGPDEYFVKDAMKSKLLEATNLSGSLYDAVRIVNDETAFIGIGKPGAGETNSVEGA